MTVLREHFRSADLGEAESYIQRSYGNVDLDAEDLVFEETSVGDERFALRRLSVEGGYSADCDLDAVIVVQSDGDYEWEVAGERGTATAPVLFQPGSTLACRLQDTRVRVVGFPVEVLTDLARTVYNDDAINVSFAGAHPVSPSLARAWQSAASLAFESGGAFDSDLIRAAAFRSLAVTTLETFATVGDRRKRAESVAQQQGAYRRAVAFFEQHASLPITIDDAASAAGVSTAALDRAFRTHSVPGRTPQEHLLAVRLDAAHTEMVGSSIDAGLTVRAVAARWGFTPRELTRHHLQIYGTRPADLLGL